MKKVAVIVLALALLTMTFAVVPVMAKGPLQAGIVGHNPNIQAVAPPIGLVQMDASENTMIWVDVADVIVHDCEAGTGAGRANNALIADITIVNDMVANPEDYYNKWVFLSGGPSGMMHEYALRMWGPDMAALIVVKHPNGMFIMNH